MQVTGSLAQAPGMNLLPDPVCSWPETRLAIDRWGEALL